MLRDESIKLEEKPQTAHATTKGFEEVTAGGRAGVPGGRNHVTTGCHLASAPASSPGCHEYDEGQSVVKYIAKFAK